MTLVSASSGSAATSFISESSPAATVVPDSAIRGGTNKQIRATRICRFRKVPPDHPARFCLAARDACPGGPRLNRLQVALSLNLIGFKQPMETGIVATGGCPGCSPSGHVADDTL